MQSDVGQPCDSSTYFFLLVLVASTLGDTLSRKLEFDKGIRVSDVAEQPLWH